MSLYLKYRPKDFSSLVGQEFIKETLKKTISEDKSVGAYIFCGPRGTGKTSSARIFSMALNCLNNHDGNPCLECDNCKSFLAGKMTDVIEIDAASHTGVDNIREEIIEKAVFQPNIAKYKIYIIDETHMLSKGAFNALLKILEEPPAHVKFILATTEVNKVPETILSRCQRYDFSKITKNDIKSRLDFIAKEEGVEADPEAIDYIVKNSDGGLRNAISLFEQFIIGGKISFDFIKSNLGLVSSDKIEEIINKILNKDRKIIHEIKEIQDSGVNMKLFFKDILFNLRDNLIADFSLGNEKTSNLKLLNLLGEAFVKSKNSFDEILPFFIAIITFISGDSLIEEKIITKKEIGGEIKKTDTKEVIKKEKIETEIKENKQENVDLDDAFSIFGDEEIIISEEKSKLENTNTTNFNIELLFAELKKEGGKAFLNLAIKSSETFIKDDKLHIKAKTKFNFDKINTIDNITLLNQKLIDLGFNYQVKIEM
ncbi:MAG: DNA polymerase III subunit gamma/tau [Candidatus Gracilibacteria bacterium]|nr:DNA polymerase III subunit gamma/tau [Candidatus Gracilibacteria bacterium]